MTSYFTPPIKILQITKNKFPPEIRVKKEAISLQQEGFISAVICPPFDNQPEFEIWEGIHIFRPKYLFRIPLVDKFLFYTCFFSFAWKTSLEAVNLQFRPDCIHIHDIWLARTALSVFKQEKIIVDLHENMPAAVLQFRRGYSGFQSLFRSVFHSSRRILLYERKILNRSDKVLVVVSEALTRVLRQHPKLSHNRIHVVENLESRFFALNNDSVSSMVISHDYFTISYIGGVTPERGLDTVIKALSILRPLDLPIKLYIIGADESAFVTSLKKLVADLALDQSVIFIPWIPFLEVSKAIYSSSLCTVPHHSNSHTDNTIPHKLYQYLSMSKPVLVSSSVPLARVVSNSQSGLIFSAGDHVDCANQIKYAFDHPGLLDQFSINAHHYVYDLGHNWEDESHHSLISAYSDLLQ